MHGVILDPGDLVILGVIAFGAFATEGAIGFGSTVLALSLGAQIVDFHLLLPALVPLGLMMSSWLLSRGFHTVAWRMLATEVAPAVAGGAAIGFALFHLPAKNLFAFVFGVFVVGLACLQLARPTGKPLSRGLHWLLLGLGGVVHGLFGTGGPMIVYVVRRRLPDKLAFRSTLAVLWLVLNVALLVNYTSAGLYHRSTFRTLAVLALAFGPGLYLGNRLHHRLDPARFERIVWIVLLFAGLALAIRYGTTLAG